MCLTSIQSRRKIRIQVGYKIFVLKYIPIPQHRVDFFVLESQKEFPLRRGNLYKARARWIKSPFYHTKKYFSGFHYFVHPTSAKRGTGKVRVRCIMLDTYVQGTHHVFVGFGDTRTIAVNVARWMYIPTRQEEKLIADGKVPSKLLHRIFWRQAHKIYQEF